MVEVQLRVRDKLDLWDRVYSIPTHLLLLAINSPWPQVPSVSVPETRPISSILN